MAKKRQRVKAAPVNVDLALMQADAERAAAQRRHDQEARQRNGYGGFDSFYGYGYARSGATSRVEDEPATTLARRPAVQGSGRFKSARERKAARAQAAARSRQSSGKAKGGKQPAKSSR